MCHNRPTKSLQFRLSVTEQRGSMLLVALFVIIVIAALAATLQKVLSVSARSVAYEVYGIRALSAANTGAEVALQRIFNPLPSADDLFEAEGTPADPEELNIRLESQSFLDAMYNCRVDIQINQFRLTDSSLLYDYLHYRIKSTARCNSAGFLTVRTVSLEGREIPSP